MLIFCSINDQSLGLRIESPSKSVPFFFHSNEHTTSKILCVCVRQNLITFFHLLSQILWQMKRKNVALTNWWQPYVTFCVFFFLFLYVFSNIGGLRKDTIWSIQIYIQTPTDISKQGAEGGGGQKMMILLRRRKLTES